MGALAVWVGRKVEIPRAAGLGMGDDSDVSPLLCFAVLLGLPFFPPFFVVVCLSVGCSDTLMFRRFVCFGRLFKSFLFGSLELRGQLTSFHGYLPFCIYPSLPSSNSVCVTCFRMTCVLQTWVHHT